VSAGARSVELATWLARDLGLPVSAMDLGAQFRGLPAVASADHAYCLPLLGVLLRTESREL
ncbi:MAG: hypothetical protein WA174_00570, partial [Rhodoferax sp.]